MRPVSLFALVLTLLAFEAHAQVTCDVTKALSEDKFRSSFRNAYIDLFGSNRENNLVNEANRLFSKVSFNKMSNRGDNCMQRTSYTETLCKKCMRKLGRRSSLELFRKRRADKEKGDFSLALSKRMCELEDACKRRPRPSMSPLPAAGLKLRMDSDDAVSRSVMFRFALVADETSTFLTFAGADISGTTELWPFQGTLLELETEERDDEFYNCASAMLLAKPDVADIAAETVRAMCFAVDGGANFNEECAASVIGWQVCEGLEIDGCVPKGTMLLSQCD